MDTPDKLMMYPNEPKINNCLLPNLSMRSKPAKVKMMLVSPIKTELKREALAPSALKPI